MLEFRSFGRVGSAALLLTVGITSPGCCRHPSDAELIGRFQEHREEFETLKTMITEDVKLDRIGPPFYLEGAEGRADAAQLGLTAERLAQYRVLMEGLGILVLKARPARPPKAHEVIPRDERDVWMVASDCYAFFAPEESTKYYYYSKHPWPPVVFVEDTDVRRATDPPVRYVYHRIEGDWYICYVGH